jgi:hypothetical protein
LLFLQENTMMIDTGERKTGYVAVVFSDKAGVLPEDSDFAAWERKTNEVWDTRLKWTLGNIPSLKTANRTLGNYYKRSLVSGLVCIWEKPDFKLNPTLVTSGLDGGSMTTFIWDVAGYAPNLISLMMGDKILDIARTMASIYLEKYNVLPRMEPEQVCGMLTAPLVLLPWYTLLPASSKFTRIFLNRLKDWY